MTGILEQLNISGGGMPKMPILAARVTIDGLTGDWQKNRKYHGGPNRAVCLFSIELYEQLKAEGMPMSFGSVGENFTTRGINLQHLHAGDRLEVGGCTIELTDIRIPCTNLDKWHDGLKDNIKGRSGWVAKVVVEGDVKPGDPIRKVER